MFHNAKLKPDLKKKSKRRCEIYSVVSACGPSCVIVTVDDFDRVCNLDRGIRVTNAFVIYCKCFYQYLDYFIQTGFSLINAAFVDLSIFCYKSTTRQQCKFYVNEKWCQKL